MTEIPTLAGSNWEYYQGLFTPEHVGMAAAEFRNMVEGDPSHPFILYESIAGQPDTDIYNFCFASPEEYSDTIFAFDEVLKSYPAFCELGQHLLDLADEKEDVVVVHELVPGGVIQPHRDNQPGSQLVIGLEGDSMFCIMNDSSHQEQRIEMGPGDTIKLFNPNDELERPRHRVANTSKDQSRLSLTLW